MKTCSKCGKDKPFSQYAKRKRGRDGLSSECKECLKVRHQEWRANNTDKTNEYGRKYYRADPDKFIKRSAAWAAGNPGKVASYKAKWYDRNKNEQNQPCMDLTTE